MPGQNKRELDADNAQFTFASSLQFAFTADQTKPEARKRTFSGVAYSGEVISNHYYWGNVVFDLTSMSVPDKLPALIDHDRDKRAGYADSSSIGPGGLVVSGILMSNDHGKSVANDSDEGFPWQMSVHINPGSIEEVQPGASIEVNGKMHTGPLTVFRNSRISEVSFTATGWDPNTSAAAMSRGGDQPPQGETAMDLKTLQDRVAALEAENGTLQASKQALETKLSEANEALAKFSQNVRVQAVKSLFSDLGKEFKEDDADVKAFSSMPQESYDAMAKILRDQKKAAPTQSAALFSHQAAQGAAPEPKAESPLVAAAKAQAALFSKRPK